METDKPINESSDDDEPREYSSPACYQHEFEQQPTDAAKAKDKAPSSRGQAEQATPVDSKRSATP